MDRACKGGVAANFHWVSGTHHRRGPERPRRDAADRRDADHRDAAGRRDASNHRDAAGRRAVDRHARLNEALDAELAMAEAEGGSRLPRADGARRPGHRALLRPHRVPRRAVGRRRARPAKGQERRLGEGRALLRVPRKARLFLPAVEARGGAAGRPRRGGARGGARGRVDAGDTRAVAARAAARRHLAAAAASSEPLDLGARSRCPRSWARYRRPTSSPLARVVALERQFPHCDRPRAAAAAQPRRDRPQRQRRRRAGGGRRHERRRRRAPPARRRGG